MNIPAYIIEKLKRLRKEKQDKQDRERERVHIEPVPTKKPDKQKDDSTSDVEFEL
jgi:hypothetical protein